MVDEATREGPINKEQIIQWITTGALAMIPVIVAYQGQILPMIPPQYALIAAIGFGALVQAASGARVRAAKDRVFGLVDEGQYIIKQKQEEIEKLQVLLDEAQAKVNAAQMVNEPILE